MGTALVMVVKDEADVIGDALDTVRDHIDHYTIVDTGSTDRTKRIIRKKLRHIEGQLIDRPWVSYGANRTEALQLARDTADWLLMLDADMTTEWHPDLTHWLATDPDPDTAAWQILIREKTLSYRLPLLIRGNLDWHYIGASHECLDPAGRKQRPMLGLTITHRADGANRQGKLERDLQLLQPGYNQGDPRDTYYYAQTLRDLGRTDEAITAYQTRVQLDGWEEETWHAAYQAAALREDTAALIAAHQQRPWRHEPLTAAARITASRGAQDDLLFNEQGP